MADEGSGPRIDLRQIAFASPEYDEMIALRLAVLGYPNRLEFKPEEIERERDDFHLGGFVEGVLGACLVLTPLENGLIHMRQVCVRPELRRSGVGRMIVTAAEEYGREHGFRLIVLYSVPEAVPFYAALGYRYVDEWPPEAGVPEQMTAKAL